MRVKIDGKLKGNNKDCLRGFYMSHMALLDMALQIRGHLPDFAESI